ncbi:MAG TPA: glycosyltransferase [Planctomycetota bacterium]|nr:glycosyltransferase [Planctomycetota bacterium]
MPNAECGTAAPGCAATGKGACATRAVLQFVDALLRGGAERLLVELAVRLDRARFAPAVACFRQEAFGAELAAAGRTVHVVPKRRAFDVGLLFRLTRLLRREKIAAVHAHDLQSATYGLLAGVVARVPVVLTVHGLGIFRQKRAAWLLPRLGRWLARVVFVGHWLQRAAADEFGVRPRRPMVVHNGVDLSAFQPGPPEPELRADMRVGEGTLVVGTVGNLRAVKDYPCLLRAFAVARARAANAVLVFVGEGAERPALEALARELGIERAVRFAGARSDVARLLRLFDIFALSSQTEGISVALLEAMATGLPAVVTHTGGNPEVAIEGRTAHLVPVGDPAQMGEALARLLADPARRRAWGQAARTRVEEEFSLDRMVRAYEAVYEELTRRR